MKTVVEKKSKILRTFYSYRLQQTFIQEELFTFPICLLWACHGCLVQTNVCLKVLFQIFTKKQIFVEGIFTLVCHA